MQLYHVVQQNMSHFYLRNATNKDIEAYSSQLLFSALNKYFPHATAVENLSPKFFTKIHSFER